MPGDGTVTADDMSLSLSSLLNPSPDSETGPPSPQNNSLPPIQYVQSPEQQQRSPTMARSGPQQFAHSSSTAQEAAQALASLSTSPAPPPTQWNGYTPQDQAQLEQQRSWDGQGDPMQLPPPLSAGGSRPMSSPTLDQYQVASRSPEQRRASAVSLSQSNITLPPIQGLPSTSSNQATREPPISNHDSKPPPQSPSGIAHSNHDSNISYYQTQEHDMDTKAQVTVQAHAIERLALPHLKTQPSHTSALDEETGSSPADIKQEPVLTPQPSSPTDARRPSDIEHHTLKAVASLKNEHGLRTQSPLRESSVPVPTTELATSEQQVSNPKKRSAPTKTKKGTASTIKKHKARPLKKRKVDVKRSATPSSRASKAPMFKGASAQGTPHNSSPTPSTRSYSADPNEESYDEDEEMENGDDDGDVYCICRKPDNGTFMIGCDGKCDDWYHGKCVGIEERDKNLIDKYICPRCETSGVAGRTTWKRMCRRGGCRQPAKIGKSKNGASGSKYCSDECGVQYFRDMVGRTRGREESGKNRSSRRTGSVTGSSRPFVTEDDMGAKGGALSAGEVKALLDVSQTAEDFKKLGDGVLSPPATPDGKIEKSSEFSDPEVEALQRIQTEKDNARRRHALLKDRMKFVTLVKQAASRTTTEKELKPKEYCGYDPRLEWTEEQFQTWRNGNAGQRVFELDTLQIEKRGDNNPDSGVQGAEDESVEICERKKCARHLEWAKLSVDDLRFEMGDNSDRMRALDREEREIRERAAVRAKTGNLNGEGSVEVHGLGTAHALPEEDKMDIDPAPPKNNGLVAAETPETPRHGAT